jgi:hypothetical protein
MYLILVAILSTVSIISNTSYIPPPPPPHHNNTMTIGGLDVHGGNSIAITRTLMVVMESQEAMGVTDGIATLKHHQQLVIM